MTPDPTMEKLLAYWLKRAEEHPDPTERELSEVEVKLCRQFMAQRSS